MHLFVSDIHFGRHDADAERALERDLIAFLRSVRDEVEGLYLVGDVFEHYIEYRHSIPKGCSRFLGMIADWTDSGIPVTYHLGNHDPWHRDYFDLELGVRVVEHDSMEIIDGRRVYVTHGDGVGKRAFPYSLVKPILRHPMPYRLYTGVLPSDWGLGIAKWYSGRTKKKKQNSFRIDAMREASRHLLTHHDADVVIMGHCHSPEIKHWETGIYANTGAWYMDRTAVIIDTGDPFLVQWTDGGMRRVPA